MSGSKTALVPTTRNTVVTNTSKSLTFDALNQELVVIVPDIVQAGATGGDILWPKMTAQNKSSFWGPLN